MPYFDIVTRPEDGKKINRKKDDNERFLKLHAFNLFHFFQRWLLKEKPVYDSRVSTLDKVREYSVRERRGRTIVQYKHERDYDPADIADCIRKGK